MPLLAVEMRIERGLRQGNDTLLECPPDLRTLE